MQIVECEPVGDGTRWVELVICSIGLMWEICSTLITELVDDVVAKRCSM